MTNYVCMYVDFFTVTVVWELMRYLSKEILWKNLNFSSLFHRLNFAKWTFIKRFPLTIELLIKRFYTKLKRFIVNITVSHNGFTLFTLKCTLQCMCMHTHYEYYLGNIQVISFFSRIFVVVVVVVITFKFFASLSLFNSLSVCYLYNVRCCLFIWRFIYQQLFDVFTFFFFFFVGLLSLLLFYLLYFVLFLFSCYMHVYMLLLLLLLLLK